MALPILTFVYRPGGDAHHNVFTDWPSLMAVLHRVEGRKIIEFDDTLEPSGCEIPAGSWNMHDVMWTGAAPSAGKPRAIVRIQEGATFTDFRMIGGQITIVNQATSTSPIADFVENSLHQVHIGLRDDCGNAQFINPGSAPLFDLGEGPPNQPNKRVLFFVQNALIGISARINGQLVLSANPLIANDGGVDCTLNFLGQNQTGERLVRGRRVRFGALSSSTQIGLDNAIAVDTSAGEMANEFAPVTRIQRKVQPHPPNRAAKSEAEVGSIDRPNVLLRCDGNGSGFELALPVIRGGFTFGAQVAVPLYSGGQEIVVAEVAGGNNLRVKAAPPDDTIDGSPEPVIFRAYESRVFASDGESNWITIASHLNPPVSLPQQLSLRAIQLEKLIIPHVGGFGRRDFAFDLPGLSGRGFLLLNVNSTARVGLSVSANGDLVVSREVEKNERTTIYEALPPNLLESGNALTVEVSFSAPNANATPEVSISDVLVVYQSG